MIRTAAFALSLFATSALAHEPIDPARLSSRYLAAQSFTESRTQAVCKILVLGRGGRQDGKQAQQQQHMTQHDETLRGICR